MLGLKPLVERNAVDSLGRSDVGDGRMYELAKGALGLVVSTAIWLLLDGGTILDAYAEIMDTLT
jgi:hypothetical protein